MISEFFKQKIPSCLNREGNKKERKGKNYLFNCEIRNMNKLFAFLTFQMIVQTSLSFPLMQAPLMTQYSPIIPQTLPGQVIPIVSDPSALPTPQIVGTQMPIFPYPMMGAQLPLQMMPPSLPVVPMSPYTLPPMVPPMYGAPPFPSPYVPPYAPPYPATGMGMPPMMSGSFGGMSSSVSSNPFEEFIKANSAYSYGYKSALKDLNIGGNLERLFDSTGKRMKRSRRSRSGRDYNPYMRRGFMGPPPMYGNPWYGMPRY